MTLACACSKNGSRSSEASTTPPEPTVEQETKTAPTEDPPERRGYGPKDMSYHACAKAEEDDTVHGEHCPRGFAVFGPYVGAPENSDVEVSFEIQPSIDTGVYSDLVSNVGQTVHGALTEQSLHAKERRKLGYRVHFFSAASKLEARIALYADAPVDFQIYNLSVVVR